MTAPASPKKVTTNLTIQGVAVASGLSASMFVREVRTVVLQSLPFAQVAVTLSQVARITGWMNATVSATEAVAFIQSTLCEPPRCSVSYPSFPSGRSLSTLVDLLMTRLLGAGDSLQPPLVSASSLGTQLDLAEEDLPSSNLVITLLFIVAEIEVELETIDFPVAEAVSALSSLADALAPALDIARTYIVGSFPRVTSTVPSLLPLPLLPSDSDLATLTIENGGSGHVWFIMGFAAAAAVLALVAVSMLSRRKTRLSQTPALPRHATPHALGSRVRINDTTGTRDVRTPVVPPRHDFDACWPTSPSSSLAAADVVGARAWLTSMAPPQGLRGGRQTYSSAPSDEQPRGTPRVRNQGALLRARARREIELQIRRGAKAHAGVARPITTLIATCAPPDNSREEDVPTAHVLTAKPPSLQEDNTECQ